MAEQHEGIYQLVRTSAIKYGIEESLEKFATLFSLSDEVVGYCRSRYKSGIHQVGKGGPVIKVKREGWYPGAQDNDPSWSYLQNALIEDGKSGLIPSLNEQSDTIVDLTPDPKDPPRTSKGLVVGFVQSGKTTNFMAVAAKMADIDYRLVIVLAGIHNQLREQTQTRMREYLVPDDAGRWFVLTRPDTDFDLSKLNEEPGVPQSHDATAYLSTEGKTTLLVVKKNHVVLKKLKQWLSDPNALKVLRNQNVLVIDDEADQASVETRSINPLIREILQFFPRGTYIGYTATPFANVFINPKDADDLYPRDFIYPLKRPEGYFGPEMLFGRDVLDLEGENIEGYDMVRDVPDEDYARYRPTNNDEKDSFVPEMTDELKAAISWFFLATAARRARGDNDDSSMLIHTSFDTEVHNSYEPVVAREKRRISKALKLREIKVLEDLRNQWESETARVPASDWLREIEAFENLLPYLASVVEESQVIVDNYKSEKRLSYEDNKTNVVIAIGGNTLSRGITLSGLVSSFFLRPAKTYDSLMQMGRWFGFRNGYEDLPRIWTTPSLKRSFRHLSLVEHEMRTDMEVYQRQGLTPMDVAVKIRTHPSLRITAKMGAADPAETSYSGARIQATLYTREDRDTLEKNWAAGETLISTANAIVRAKKLQNGATLFERVPVGAVLKFLDNYEVHEMQTDMDTSLIVSYIEKANGHDSPRLIEWNIAVMTGEGQPGNLGGVESNMVLRSPLKGSDDIADIKSLMSKQDLVVDIPELSIKEAKKISERDLKIYRSQTCHTKDRGLIALYPIDPESAPTTDRSRAVREPMSAKAPILGLAMVFPITSKSASETDKVQSTHVAVDLAPDAEEIDTSLAMFGNE